MWPSKQKPALFAPSGISRNTVLKYSVTKTLLYCPCVLSSKVLLVFIIANFSISDGWNSWYFLPSLSASVLIIEGVGGVRWGGVGGGKSQHLGHLRSSHDAHTVVSDTIVGHIISGTNPGPQCPSGALHGCHCSSCDFGGSAKCPSEKQTS